ncbi:MAG: integrase, partial [Gammaproteobacteria bacterium CG11_big_fil_rev_8_21_14_0_20_46_22]
TIEQLNAFLAGTQRVAFEVAGDKDACYQWIQKTLLRFHYQALNRQGKGVLIRYLMKVSGYSRQQVTRLVKQYRDQGRLTRRQRTVNGFSRRFTDRDIRLLAEMDERHNSPNGPAMRKLCERAYRLFGQTEYQRLASISVAHLYNLRKSKVYLRQRRTLEKTRPRASHIGERRKPRPNGQPGYIRIDTVHQGDWDKQKGVYHINAVDEITQLEIVVSVEKISERYLIPALEQLLEDFPFVILGFHSDNGSEYINKQVARLLEKLRIEFTKSRSRQTNDNALAESKNGHVVRKLFGYTHIPQHWAPLINDFNRKHLNPYINYHRPCLFPEIVIDAKGKQRKRYPHDTLMTPYEKLKSLPSATTYLKPGMTFEILDAIAYQISDNEAADQLQQARRQLFKTIHEQQWKRA